MTTEYDTVFVFVKTFGLSGTAKKRKPSWLFFDLKCSETRFLYPVYYVNEQACYLSASKIKNKEGKPELQIVIPFNSRRKA